MPPPPPPAEDPLQPQTHYGHQMSNLTAPVIMRCVEHMAHPGMMPPPPPPLQPSTTPAQEPMQNPDLAIPPVIHDNRGHDNRDGRHARMSCENQRRTASRRHSTPPPWLNNSHEENSSRSPSPLEKLMNRDPPPDAHEAETALLQHYTRVMAGPTAAELAEAGRRPPKGSVGRHVEEQLRSTSPPRGATTRKKPVRTKSRQTAPQQPMQLKAKARPQRTAAPHGFSLSGGSRPTPYVSVGSWLDLCIGCRFLDQPPQPQTQTDICRFGGPPYLSRIGLGGGGRSRWQAGRHTHPIRPSSSLRP